MPTAALRQQLAELRGPAVPQPLDARALAALAANPGCRRRTLLDGAGIDKRALARALGSPATFGQSQFAHQRGNVFEARVTADGGAELLRLLYERLGGAASGLPAPEPGTVLSPDLTAVGPQGRTARTALALREATAAGRWALLDHPMVSLDVAGSPAFLEPDAVVVRPDGTWTVVEIKSFPLIDGAADPAKVGAAARQAAVYVLALERVAERIGGPDRVHAHALLVCPKDFSNLPTAELVDVRKQRSVTRRQLTRLTRVEEIAAALPGGTTFDLRLADDGRTPTRPAAELAAAVDAVDAAYAPECLAACELAFHCRQRARAVGSVEALGRGARGELGGLATVADVLAAARYEIGPSADPGDPAVEALRRAAVLRAEALAGAPAARPAAGHAEAAGHGETACRGEAAGSGKAACRGEAAGSGEAAGREQETARHGEAACR
ncbi:hypothetical protein [Streptomyces sp. XD-27]|uniref:hypothetical protein n=1 Tax=Streptomyces sp. XD-27 TaxID=3062779 RepID=UPI0026F45A10|nr:hypothetical protein [Streptomyces sp. XD-27]WKX74221.1 hypothetical protein Q3Y56_11495 [Streptomyces sp. XD-27]